MRAKADYGIDSPAIVCGYLIAAALVSLRAILNPQFRWIEAAVAGYCLHGALSMLHYSKVGKLRLRDTLLDQIPWRGDETVLDAGCGKGLLLAGAARRLSTGRAIGVDLWLPKALSGNSAEAVQRNLELEGVADRATVKKADVRELPFENASFDVVVSNFVLHELNTPAERRRMLEEMVRVLKPGGRLALIDFIFTKEAVGMLRAAGLADASRTRLGGFGSMVATVLMLGTFQLCVVTGCKGPASSAVRSLA